MDDIECGDTYDLWVECMDANSDVEHVTAVASDCIDSIADGEYSRRIL